MYTGKSYFHKRNDSYLDFDGNKISFSGEWCLTKEETKRLFISMLIHYKANDEDFYNGDISKWV